MTQWLVPIYVAMSVVSFAVYAMDKRAASRARRRVPEATLHLLDLLCGWPGGYVAQRLLRHKSRKVRFRIVFWLTATANVTVLVYLMSWAR